MLIRLFLNRAAGLEEYRRTVRGCRKIACGLAALGLLTLAAALLAVPELLAGSGREDFFSGFYSGVGTGVMAAAAVWYIRLGRLLGDEAALKRAYIKDTDERNRQINTRALLSAGLVLVCLLYIGLLTAGLFYPVLFWFCLAAAVLYVLLTLLFRWYYQRTM